LIEGLGHRWGWGVGIAGGGAMIHGARTSSRSPEIMAGCPWRACPHRAGDHAAWLQHPASAVVQYEMGR